MRLLTQRKALFAPLCLLLMLLAAGVARADEVLVSAAASLTDALTVVGKAFTKANPGTTVRFNFGASGALLQQIRAGAPVDVFASASPKEMNALASEGRIEAETRFNFVGNRLVLIAPPKSPVKGWADLKLPSVRRVAISDPASVPSGRYAQETLTKRGLWDTVKPKTILGQNVRQTLAYVTGGDVDAGIVFATDALIAKDKVRVVAEAVPGKDHTPIVYPAAVVINAPSAPAARRFALFLKSPAARAILKQYGFTPPPS